MSTNSDPNEASLSLLARISAKSNPTASTPIDMNPNGFQFTGGRPPTGSLRVDTSALDGPSVKQNKSAYPSFASNGILLPAPEPITAKSPAPVTAGPDLGRHNLARMEIVGYNSVSLGLLLPPTHADEYGRILRKSIPRIQTHDILSADLKISALLQGIRSHYLVKIATLE